MSQFSNIKAFVFDCDGVMTNGTALITETGEGLRSFNIKDGYAIQHAVKKGYPIAIISGGKGMSIEHRFKGLGVKDIYLNQSHKVETFFNFCKKYNLETKDVAYMGDDMPDIPILKICGTACCPKDACNDVLEICTFISSKNGGKGCARELIETTMRAQETWLNETSHHF